MIYEGKTGRRKYLILPKKEYSQSEAVKFASEFWHCRIDQIILSGAKKKNDNEFYVERPFDFGAWWCMYRGCKTDTENVIRFIKGSNEEAKGV